MSFSTHPVYINRSYNPATNFSSHKMGVSAAALNSPLNIFGSLVEAWYVANQGVTLITGVSQWDDQSGNGHHLVQASGTKQPAYVVGGLDGRPHISFDGVDNSLAVGDFTFALDSRPCVLVVGNFDDATAAVNQAVFDLGDSADDPVGRVYLSAATDQWRLEWHYNGDPDALENFELDNDTDPHLFAHLPLSTGLELQVDGTTTSGVTSAGMSARAGSGMQLTIGSSTTEAAPGDVNVSEVLVLNGEPTAAMLTANESRVATLWSSISF